MTQIANNYLYDLRLHLCYEDCSLCDRRLLEVVNIYLSSSSLQGLFRLPVTLENSDRSRQRDAPHEFVIAHNLCPSLRRITIFSAGIAKLFKANLHYKSRDGLALSSVRREDPAQRIISPFPPPCGSIYFSELATPLTSELLAVNRISFIQFERGVLLLCHSTFVNFWKSSLGPIQLVTYFHNFSMASWHIIGPMIQIGIVKLHK